jgi:hypothetical protein
MQIDLYQCASLATESNHFKQSLDLGGIIWGMATVACRCSDSSQGEKKRKNKKTDGMDLVP